jgi:hypothetical protein
MSDFARPAFAGKIRTEGYYTLLNQAIQALRYTVPNSVIASRLNALGITSPRNLPWTRQRIAAYLSNNK